MAIPKLDLPEGALEAQLGHLTLGLRRARWSVMSRATVMAPTTAPSASNSGDTLSTTMASEVSFRRRTVSRCSIEEPPATREMIVSSSARRSSGTSMATWRPITSSAV